MGGSGPHTPRQRLAPEGELSRNATDEMFYGTDLSHVHHTGFTESASGAAPALIRALGGAGRAAGPVVELGCGSGVLASALVEAGYSVIGVDRSPAMLELARATAPGASFVQASLYALRLPPCIAVFAIGEGLSYIGKEDPGDALPGLVASVYEALAPGGIFAFDLVLTSARTPQRYSAERTESNWKVSVEVTEFPERSLLVRRITTAVGTDDDRRESIETHRVRTFSRSRVEDLLRGAGFSVRVRRGYGETALPPRRLAFFARKRVSGKVAQAF